MVTGGAGYIGSHIVLALLQSNYDVIVLDNLSNSSIVSLQRVSQICDRTPLFVEGDVRDRDLLDMLFAKHSIDAVLHLAGLKAVGDSVRKPAEYFSNNLSGTITLCLAMAAAGVHRLVFSSSATVYGASDAVPISEDQPVGNTTNPYARSKFFAEKILDDLAVSDSRWSIALLRYFNPVGAHESGLIGEHPHGIPNNLMPYICQVAAGKLPELLIFGNDYPTPDGTGVRDYIHVVDLAEGHLAALNALSSRKGINVWNLGTGEGYSVFQLIKAFEIASGREVPYRIVGRRTGDVSISFADPVKASFELCWTAKRGINLMVRDAWRWQTMNPNGY